MSNEVRYCVFCDVVVKEMAEPKRTIGRESESTEQLYIHNGPHACPRTSLTESQTYTEGVSDRRSDEG